ncbi:molybdopterin-dependent oxidoreductase [Halomonas sp. E19]|uniref:molybdopterin-dependent oxidoreductase n=1 Tax=Halomonas sp. E19 TaxID=3397247 RepID=UPI004034B0EA
MLSLLPALAATLPPPSGEVILRVTGAVAYPNVGAELHLDRALMMMLAPTEVVTHTPWTEGAGHFEGPLFRAVLEAAGVQADEVRVSSLDGFGATVPVAELHDYSVILAVLRDGEPLTVRDLGPVFVLYPFDDHPELLTQAVRFRSVWHASEIHVP